MVQRRIGFHVQKICINVDTSIRFHDFDPRLGATVYCILCAPSNTEFGIAVYDVDQCLRRVNAPYLGVILKTMLHVIDVIACSMMRSPRYFSQVAIELHNRSVCRDYSTTKHYATTVSAIFKSRENSTCMDEGGQMSLIQNLAIVPDV